MRRVSWADRQAACTCCRSDNKAWGSITEKSIYISHAMSSMQHSDCSGYTTSFIHQSVEVNLVALCRQCNALDCILDPHLDLHSIWVLRCSWCGGFIAACTAKADQSGDAVTEHGIGCEVFLFISFVYCDGSYNYRVRTLRFRIFFLKNIVSLREFKKGYDFFISI